jgi:type VI secretion system protein ImpL
MVALLETTMWRQVRDPEFLLGALKTYRMMTGLSQMDPDFAKEWWVTRLPEFAETPPFPTDAALAYQLDAIDRMVYDTSFVPPDDALVAASLNTVCSIPLARRAYDALLSDPAATALPEWVPATYAGPNGAKVFLRRSEKTLRVGIPGIFTYGGFHDVVLARLEEVAGQAALDRSVFAGGCPESADVSVSALADDMLKLYYEDFVAQWDGFLYDVALAPLTDLATATENLKDLSSADSALRRLLTAVVAEVDLARPEDTAAAGGSAPPKGASKILGKLGKLGKLAKKSTKFLPTAGATADLDTSGQEVSDHYRPLKGAVEEVDGVPPALDAAMASLTALSNVLQTVSASPDPEQAIKDQGGLAELTGAVANQAATLPPPLDDWLAGIAGDTTAITEQAVVSKLNAIWKADVLPFCTAALASRYPFDRGSAIDVNTADFARVFGPGGLIDSFTNDHLLPYVDTAARPWRWRADLGLDDASLASLERARSIRDALFPGGAGPIMTFTLEPKDLSPNATRVTLNLDGQSLAYFNSATRPQPMTWPGRDGTGVITLAFQPVDGSPEIMTSESGAWAWLRMLRGGRMQATELPELFRLRLSAGGYYADFDLRAASVENPMNLQMFSQFSCPAGL